MKILIGLPTNRDIKQRTVMSLLNLDNPFETEYLLANGGITVAENRNYLASQSIARKCDFLFMVDDDMSFAKDTLTQLLMRDKDIIGVNYNAKMMPLTSTVEGEVKPDLFQSPSIGAGVILINTKVFSLEQPWFDTEEYKNGLSRIGEDTYFCRKAIEAGFEVWCDPTLEIKHIGEFLY